MQKNQFIYQIHKDIPTHHKQGRLVIEIKHRTAMFSDCITISWKHNQLGSANSHIWHECKLKWERDNYNLFPLLKKVEKAKIDISSSIEKVIDFLHDNNIDNGVYITLEEAISIKRDAA